MSQEFIKNELVRLSDIPRRAVPAYVGVLCEIALADGQRGVLDDSKTQIKCLIKDAFEEESNPKAIFFMLSSMFRVHLPFYPEINTFYSLSNRFRSIEEINKQLTALSMNLEDYNAKS